MNQYNYHCPKCGSRKAEVDQIRTTGSGLTRFLDIQNRKFVAVSCSQCGYTEFYKEGKTSTASNILDAMIN
jgi:uncharacterized protein